MSTTPKTTAPLALTRLSTSLIAYCLLAVSLAFIALHLFVYQNQQHMEQQRAEFITEILSLKLAKPVAMSNNRELISVAQNQLHDTHINKLCIYDATGNLIPLYENSLVNRQCPINTVRTPLARQKGWHHRPLILNTNTLGTIWVYTPRQPWLEWVTTQFGIIGLFFGLLIIIALWMHYHLNMLIIAPLKAISTHLETADIDQDVTIPKQLVARHPLGGFTQVLHDRITAINTHNDQLKEIAFNDPLTGLPNRRHFWEHLTVSVHRLKRTHKPIAVLLVDLDGFKAVNDRLGHEIGDALLTEVARTMRTCLRQEDFLARLGGDEFTLVLRDCDDPVVPKRIAQKILHALDRTFTIEGEDIRIGASIGIAMAPFDGRETHELTRMADKAMYLAKRRGKSRFAFWSESLNQFSDNLAHDESIILQAIEHNALNLQLVPQHDFSAQRSIVGIEAVTTLRHDASTPHLSRSVEEVIMQSDNAKLLLRYHSWLFKEISTLISRWKANPRYHKTLLPLTVQLAPHKLQLTCCVHAYKE
ncbi:MAG: diguanylate cyclase, partial [Gammaproteobacteria bacterium]